jgi:hypothetical protein
MARVTGPEPAPLRRLLRAKDHMDRAWHESWPVRRLAAVSGVSAAHFARSFARAFGIPPHRYLLSRRIERAADSDPHDPLPLVPPCFTSAARRPDLTTSVSEKRRSAARGTP